MTMDIQVKAVRRYGAMSGNLTDLSDEERAQARIDRRAFEAYLPEREDGFEQVVLLLRFLHEVCHLPLWQAHCCTVSIIQMGEAFKMTCCKEPESVAGCIVRETGNVLVADVIISLHLAAAEDTEWESFWKNVSSALWQSKPYGQEELDAAKAKPALH